MADSPRAFPLAWPKHRPRTSHDKRRSGQFKADGVRINAPVATLRVENELDRMGARYPVLSSNLETRLDGRPRADRGEPGDPGVCLYFELHGKPFALACDTYTKVAQNIAAIAAHLDATRAIERHGVATAAESLQAFSALPPPSTMITPIARPWHQVLGVREDASIEVINAVYRTLASKAHPDVGGSADQMAELSRAKADGLAIRAQDGPK